MTISAVDSKGCALEDKEGAPALESVKVWDRFIRFFHWSTAVSFTVAYLSGDTAFDLHLWVGYALTTLVLSRIAWGFFGPETARWTEFVKPPRQVLGYLRETLRGNPPRHLGHNPVGGAMVVALVASLSLTALSGIALQGLEDMSGPLATLGTSLSNSWSDAFEEVHEALAGFTVFLVVFHVAGVLISSVLHGENLVRAMITGYKERAR
jgi:cytochrome b